VQSKNPLLNDFSKLLTGAFGIAQNAKSEMETIVSSTLERWISERNFVNREEFDAVRLMAQKAAERNEELEDKLLKLESKLARVDPKVTKRPKVKKA
jgi:BMFP domain-containing protein YqiC